MLKTYIIENESYSELSNAINNWLAENSDVKVIDIKYSCWGTRLGLLGPEYGAYSALILYETKSKKED